MAWQRKNTSPPIRYSNRYRTYQLRDEISRDYADGHTVIFWKRLSGSQILAVPLPDWDRSAAACSRCTRDLCVLPLGLSNPSSGDFSVWGLGFWHSSITDRSIVCDEVDDYFVIMTHLLAELREREEHDPAEGGSDRLRKRLESTSSSNCCVR